MRLGKMQVKILLVLARSPRGTTTGQITRRLYNHFYFKNWVPDGSRFPRRRTVEASVCRSLLILKSDKFVEGGQYWYLTENGRRKADDIRACLKKQRMMLDRLESLADSL